MELLKEIAVFMRDIVDKDAQKHTTTWQIKLAAWSKNWFESMPFHCAIYRSDINCRLSIDFFYEPGGKISKLKMWKEGSCKHYEYDTPSFDTLKEKVGKFFGVKLDMPKGDSEQ
jgi:hypothetical protein